MTRDDDEGWRTCSEDPSSEEEEDEDSSEERPAFTSGCVPKKRKREDSGYESMKEDGNDKEEESVGRLSFGSPVSDVSYQCLERPSRLYHLEFFLRHCARQEQHPPQPEEKMICWILLLISLTSCVSG
ncbi:Hypothetical predicted protein [Scomber scombrus]|uniref:Uncharacterized protein n=1 Tax=Scomber scombrus TaxID=13677 RepID=A0AAV1PZ20_SCOSC